MLPRSNKIPQQVTRTLLLKDDDLAEQRLRWFLQAQRRNYRHSSDQRWAARFKREIAKVLALSQEQAQIQLLNDSAEALTLKPPILTHRPQSECMEYTVTLRTWKKNS